MLREATADDEPFLWEMLCHSSAEGGEPLALDDLRAIPGLARYLDGWGRPGDRGLVAVDEAGARLGAAWLRTFTASAPGYGFIDERTPELAIACVADARGRGLGHELVAGLLARAWVDGDERVSLSVNRANGRALRVYEDLGFRVVQVEDDGLHQSMVASTSPEPGGGRQIEVRRVEPGALDLDVLPPSAWGPTVARLGELVDVTALPALLAQVGEAPAGLLTWRHDPERRAIEVVGLEAWHRERGVGSALLRELRRVAAELGVGRLWLVTNNDNLAALRFYQRRGWDLVALHRGAADRSRAVKPSLPLVGSDGIAVRHELELELILVP